MGVHLLQRAGPLALLALALSLVIAVPCASARAQTTDDDRAHTHFTAGRSYFDEGNYEQALAEFNHAHELSHRDVLLANIANCQERLGLWREAADTLDRFIATLAADAPDRGTMERRTAALRERADQHDAEEAAHAEQVRAEASASATSTAPAPAFVPASDGLLVPAIVSFAFGGAAGIAWGVLGGLALGAQSSVASGCGAMRFCTPGEVADMDNFALGADVAMSVALAAIVVGAILLIVDPPHGASGAQALLTEPSLGGSF